MDSFEKKPIRLRGNGSKDQKADLCRSLVWVALLSRGHIVYLPTPDWKNLIRGKSQFLQQVVIRAVPAHGIDGLGIAGKQKGLAAASAKILLLPWTGKARLRHPGVTAKALKGY